MITSPTTVRHPLPALLSSRQNWEDHSLSLLSYAFGWSWLPEDLIRASGDGGRIRTMSVGLTPSLWVAGWVGHDWLAVSWGRVQLYCAQPGEVPCGSPLAYLCL